MTTTFLGAVLVSVSLARGQGEIVSLKSLLPQGSSAPRIYAMSDDGSHVVFSAYAPRRTFFIWSREGGLFELRPLRTEESSLISGASRTTAPFS